MSCHRGCYDLSMILASILYRLNKVRCQYLISPFKRDVKYISFVCSKKIVSIMSVLVSLVFGGVGTCSLHLSLYFSNTAFLLGFLVDLLISKFEARIPDHGMFDVYFFVLLNEHCRHWCSFSKVPKLEFLTKGMLEIRGDSVF